MKCLILTTLTLFLLSANSFSQDIITEQIDNIKKSFTDTSNSSKSILTKYKLTPPKTAKDKITKSLSKINSECCEENFKYKKDLIEIKNVFENSADMFDSIELKSLANNDRVKFVGVVTDCISRTSAAGNKYMRVEIQDDFGRVNFMLMNNRRAATLDNYLNNGGKKPKEEQIVFVYGSKGDDIIFGDKITILDEKIYTKLSEIK